MNRTEYWKKCVKELKELFREKGIMTCEIKLPGCWHNNALGFAHRRKRREYYSCPERLKDFTEVILACNACHSQIEYNKQLTKDTFERLRGKNETN